MPQETEHERIVPQALKVSNDADRDLKDLSIDQLKLIGVSTCPDCSGGCPDCIISKIASSGDMEALQVIENVRQQAGFQEFDPMAGELTFETPLNGGPAGEQQTGKEGGVKNAESVNKKILESAPSELMDLKSIEVHKCPECTGGCPDCIISKIANSSSNNINQIVEAVRQQPGIQAFNPMAGELTFEVAPQPAAPVAKPVAYEVQQAKPAPSPAQVNQDRHLPKSVVESPKAQSFLRDNPNVAVKSGETRVGPGPVIDKTQFSEARRDLDRGKKGEGTRVEIAGPPRTLPVADRAKPVQASPKPTFYNASQSIRSERDINNTGSTRLRNNVNEGFRVNGFQKVAPQSQAINRQERLINPLVREAQQAKHQEQLKVQHGLRSVAKLEPTVSSVPATGRAVANQRQSTQVEARQVTLKSAEKETRRKNRDEDLQRNFKNEQKIRLQNSAKLDKIKPLGKLDSKKKPQEEGMKPHALRDLEQSRKSDSKTLKSAKAALDNNLETKGDKSLKVENVTEEEIKAPRVDNLKNGSLDVDSDLEQDSDFDIDMEVDLNAEAELELQEGQENEPELDADAEQLAQEEETAIEAEIEENIDELDPVNSDYDLDLELEEELANALHNYMDLEEELDQELQELTSLTEEELDQEMAETFEVLLSDEEQTVISDERIATEVAENSQLDLKEFDDLIFQENLKDILHAEEADIIQVISLLNLQNDALYQDNGLLPEVSQYLEALLDEVDLEDIQDSLAQYLDQIDSLQETNVDKTVEQEMDNALVLFMFLLAMKKQRSRFEGLTEEEIYLLKNIMLKLGKSDFERLTDEEIEMLLAMLKEKIAAINSFVLQSESSY